MQSASVHRPHCPPVRWRIAGTRPRRPCPLDVHSQGNIYPVWNTKERTEVYIGNEICALVNLASKDLTVRAHRVGVHIGHFVDVRVKVRHRRLQRACPLQPARRSRRCPTAGVHLLCSSHKLIDRGDPHCYAGQVP